MQVYPNRFSEHISRNLQRFYLVFGDEPLQKMLTIESIREHAKHQGFDEKQQFSVDTGFSWHSIVEATQTLSLFSAKQYIEVELPTGKPGSEGSKTLCEIAASISEDTIIVLHGQKIGKDVQSSKWFKALDKLGVYVPCFNMEGKQLNQWVSQYARQTGVLASPTALQLICDYCEGNLLAAKQEIDKLLLLYPAGNVDDESVQKAIVDQSRFNVFQLVDMMLTGNPSKTIKLLLRLEAEGLEPTIILWALTREWQLLTHMVDEQATSSHINWNKHRIWRNKQSLYQGAMQRHTRQTLQLLGKKLSIAEQQLKQSSIARPYILIAHLVLMFIPLSLESLPLHFEKLGYA